MDLSGRNQPLATVDLRAKPAGEGVWTFEYQDAFMRPASGILLRIERPGAPPQFKAYRNLCPHWSMPLDGGTGDFLDDSGHLLECKFHGARFERDTGECIMGPCDGEFLEELRVEISADQNTATIRRGSALKLG